MTFIYSNSSQVGYYVYAYIRNKDSKFGKIGTPYYIGKGFNNRAYQTHIGLPVPNSKFNIIIMENHLTELGAFALERFYIKWYGRIDNSTGILRNRTDGGEGTSGVIRPPMSDELKLHLSKLFKGRRPSDSNIAATRLARTGKSLSIETISKIIKSRKNNGGYIRSIESISKCRETTAEYLWWTDGVKNKFSKDSLGDDFIKGYFVSDSDRELKRLAGKNGNLVRNRRKLSAIRNVFFN